MANETGLADLVRLTAHVCETSSAALALQEGTRLVLEAGHGLGPGDTAATLLACERAAAASGPLVVRDLGDAAPAGALQPANRRLRFFAGQPLLGERQERLGVLAVLDTAPRALLPRQREALQLLGRQAQRTLELERSHRELEATFAHAPIGIAVVDQHDRLVRVNPAFGELVGHDPLALAGRALAELTHADDPDLQRDQQRQRIEKRLLRADGTAVWVAMTAAPIAGDERAPLTLRIVEDVTERRRARLERERLALTDPLTGLANRRAGEQALDREIARAERRGEPMSIALLDVDNLKTINDTLGHVAGDRALQAVAAALQATVRRADLVARWGGDEFLVLLFGSALDPALRLAERACEGVGQVSLAGLPQLSVSAGCAQWQPGETATELVARADARLYSAKDGGRGVAR